MTDQEACDRVKRALGWRWRDETFPAFDTPKHNELLEALKQVSAWTDPADFGVIGLAALQFLHEHVYDLLEAQRDQAVQQLAVARGEQPPHLSH